MILYKYEWSEYKLALQYKIKSRYFDVNVTEGVPNYQKKTPTARIRQIRTHDYVRSAIYRLYKPFKAYWLRDAPTV